MDYKKHIAEKLNVNGVEKEQIASFIETPPNTEMGDFALPCFKLSKIMRMPPVKIAEQLKDEFVTDDFVSEVSAVNGYLNFKINRDGFASAVLKEIAEKGEAYGSDKIGEGKTVCIDYSSINIAKPFHIGHLSTTVIGSALC
ncbi:MAG: arginine--tRNA ligase, partial [Clostridiales bacterium]|nr:arginine--tRNA ligase [Clostridiales bacterium]